MDRWLVLEPFDTVAIRDGRNFDAGLPGIARATAPQPATVAGAVGAAFGAAPGAGADPAGVGRTVPAQVRGPVVVRERTRTGRWEALFPAARDIVRGEGDAKRLRLKLRREALGAVSHDLGGLSLLSGDGEQVDDWWTGSLLGTYLWSEGHDLSPTDPPWRTERRVGLARDGRIAIEGMLYSAEHLRPVGRIGFGALCVDAPAGALAETVRLGGEGRRAQVHECVGAAAPALPGPPDSFPDGRLLLYLATPAVFVEGWRPSEGDLGGGRLISAAVAGPHPIAMARPDHRTGGVADKRIIWTVAPGSVYFLVFDSETAARAAGEKWHGTALPQADDTLRTAGFGLALVGRWSWREPCSSSTPSHRCTPAPIRVWGRWTCLCSVTGIPGCR
jgi:CRISPR-associated protein Cmr3